MGVNRFRMMDIQHTLTYYSMSAKLGWCFYINRVLPKYETLETNIYSRNEIIKLSEGRDIFHATLHKSYGDNGKVLDLYYPVFFKMEDKKTLIKLGALRTKVSMWELMDI